MEIKNKSINDITPYDNNPRKNDKAVSAVAESIKQYGFKVPLVVDASGMIITGHTRYKAAVMLGMEEVPCIVADDLTEEEARAFRLADNKTAEASRWDYDKLAQELDEIDADSWLLRLFSKEAKEPAEGENIEIDLSEYDEESFEYECPECGFRFNE